ncbi:uncharacterized protein LOC117345128 isoform X1 [Pecten maximus]|uniref:uncharacterized protein LOC117345128 isoform X1 n=1 Tax=Pecten maximus TaxID=6579 RepID=UPI001458A32E|nr:uncharacterized protein LOC117345128 isoform X1 [Pecten maximus]XP_033763983.1 uncharacterized protein LOC117345128 isoform X1 [Pecten maximus]
MAMWRMFKVRSRIKTIFLAFGWLGRHTLACLGIWFLLLVVIYVYLNDLPQTQKTRLTPHLFHREEGILPSTLEDGSIGRVQQPPDSRNRRTHFTPPDTLTSWETQSRQVPGGEYVTLEGRLKEYCNPPSDDLQRSEEGKSRRDSV